MDALEIGVLGLVAGFHQRLEAAAHQIHHAAAQDGLLAEQVGLGLFVHGSFQDAGTGAADAGDVSQSDIIGLAGGVLLHSDQAGHTLARHILRADGVAGTLGSGHEDVHIGGGHDLLVADVEAVGEGDGLALSQVRRDVLLVHICLSLVIDEDHDDVGGLGGLGHGYHLEAVFFRHSPGFAALAQTNDHVAATVTQVHGVSMALGAVADDGDLLAVELVQVAVLFIIHFCHS